MRADVLAAPAPDSPGDFVFILVVGVVLWVIQMIAKNRAVRTDWERRERKINELMGESAAFAARWPGPLVASAPYREVTVEHARINRVLALLVHHRTAADPNQIRHIDAQISAVQRWLTALPPVFGETGVPLREPASTAVPDHGGRPPPRPHEYPLGQPLLHFRGIAGADDIVCSVQSTWHGQLVFITPRGPEPGAWRDTTVDAHFEVRRPDGTPVMYLTRRGGLTQRIEVRDLSGTVVGELQQSSSLWRVAGTQRIPLEMWSHGHLLGSTQVRQRLWSRANEDPVHDVTGQTIAVVEPVMRDPGARRPTFDFILHCLEPQPFPVPDLLLAVGFSHYMYSRSWR
ncbi:hypothetical protein A5779_12985 [Mycolicibacterium peregrinum]|uniref:Uncharacterized protein n=2 Tax=Mycolicibacterium peregrinum TaxID=43304 RepID=A0A1A0V7S9_MYCPR|nr:hypothetical protein A5779_12985 [Mycolicibacterium peregrinum]